MTQPATKEELKKTISVPDIDAILLDPHRKKITRPAFSHWQVETLLNQALDLLERNQRERAVYDDLRTRWVELCFASYAEGQELAILKARQEKSVHTLIKRSEDEELKALEYYVNPEPLEGWGGWKEIFRCIQVCQDTAVAKGDGIAQHSFAAQHYTARRGLKRTSDSVAAQRLKVELANADAERFVATATYLSDVHEQRVSVMTATGGALNYQERFAAIQRQMETDYDDAVLRLEAAQEGLKHFFGYGAAADELNLPTSRGLEDLITWTRQAIAWMIAFAHHDQSACTRISLRQVSKDDWPKLLASLKKGDAHDLIFSWDGGIFKEALFVRTTGLCAFYVGSKKDLTLQLLVQMPIHAISFQRGGPHPLEQRLPKCLLGRIEHRDIARAPEIAATNALRNASPLGADNVAGQWNISVIPSTAIASADIEDILVEIQANVQWPVML